MVMAENVKEWFHKELRTVAGKAIARGMPFKAQPCFNGFLR
jgi:hypothetical protein